MRVLGPMIDRLRAAPHEDDLHVHFHQGPQGQPAPCFDPGCPNPRLTVEE